ncbi:unnamed protein product [Haemonchus placei]|uniref:Uncharacterized protein n=1 Tax=Haemonchus placei TaxID=6290 RepID=A0A0N4VVQ0_HAEPC|nr:unnamed protein product [Haemonchus placei]
MPLCSYTLLEAIHRGMNRTSARTPNGSFPCRRAPLTLHSHIARILLCAGCRP